MMDAITAYERTEVAKKILRIKMLFYTTDQSLVRTFANDEGLYRFLEPIPMSIPTRTVNPPVQKSNTLMFKKMGSAV